MSNVANRSFALRLLGRGLDVLLHRPRLLQFAGVLVGSVMVGMALRSAFMPSPQQPSAEWPVEQQAGETTAIHSSPISQSEEQAVLAIVTAYNQASITAAIVGRTDSMAPFLAPDGEAWSQVQHEYARRAERGESHQPTLARWGILSIAVQANTATVETQEQWDDFVTTGGIVTSSQRGIVTRNVYVLRRDQQLGWQIITVASTLVIG